MRAKNVPPAIVAAALTACAVEAESLNSERIAERFGSYGIDVLTQTDGVRRSSLYSIEGDTRVCRTYAVVEFVNESAAAVADAHAEILSGESIGETFKSENWTINKRTEHLGEIQLGASASEIGALMYLDGNVTLAMHVYLLILEKDDQSIEYARIIEIHHPDYLRPKELKNLYGDSLADADTTAALESIKSRVLGAD